MPEFDLARLATDIANARRGQGPRGTELRRRFAAVDPELRHARNAEAIRLSGLRMRLRTLDTRADSAQLQAQAEASERRLAELDRKGALRP